MTDHVEMHWQWGLTYFHASSFYDRLRDVHRSLHTHVTHTSGHVIYEVPLIYICATALDADKRLISLAYYILVNCLITTDGETFARS